MKSFAPLAFVCVGLLTGCSSTKQSHFSPTPGPSTTLVTPDTTLSAKVVSYNAVGRFVVLSFPVGEMPKTDDTLFLYHGGVKTGEVKITGPQRNTDVVGDLLDGEAQVGDEVRSQ
ncbi:MAG TPA: hypothetical protein VGI03_02310 [Verrucomicrobiae bacterium]